MTGARAYENCGITSAAKRSRPSTSNGARMRDVDLVGACRRRRRRCRSTTCCGLPVSTEPRTNSAVFPNWATRSSSLPREREVQRLGDPGGIAPDVGAMGFEHADLVPERVDADERHVPAVGVARHQLQRDLLAVTPEPDREASLLRLGFAACRSEPEELTVEVDDVFGQERSDALDRFVELAQADGRGRERDAVGVELALMPTGAEAQRHPALREVVDGRDRLRHDGRMSVGRAVHEAAAAHVRRRRRQRGVCSESFEAFVPGVRVGDVRRVEVVPHRDPPEAERLDAFPQCTELVARRVLQACVHAEDHDP